MARAHEAGALHAGAMAPAPPWLRTPEDANALLPELWASTVRRGADGFILGFSGHAAEDLRAAASRLGRAARRALAATKPTAGR